MVISVRKATLLDTRPMAQLLNDIIAEGGTTAMTRPVTGTDLGEWMQTPRSAWQVATDPALGAVGFQWIEPASELPDEAAEIATFVKIGKTGLGIGSALFENTCRAARSLGYMWINANIRADNEGGLIYYQSRGFRTYERWEGYTLSDGSKVDKILKRFDLK